MLGKGSINHNTRQFKAENIDTTRTEYNISYINTPIKKVYKELFDDAVKRYNEKQIRNDRCINNYYEKIRTGKQEKLFHEIILQVGNKDNMAVQSNEGVLAGKILNEYMKNFQNRNPNLKVFSAHLHLDEATPHLHIDFVPFTTGSKRGLDTRVSLKKALADQGFTGGTRSQTEWKQWVISEKNQLSKVMEKHGIEWEQLGTHDEHLSVMNYKKEQRIKEVTALDKQIKEQKTGLISLTEKNGIIQKELDVKTSELEKRQNNIKEIKDKTKFIAKYAKEYDHHPNYALPEPKPLISAKTYYDSYALPLVTKLKTVISRVLLQYFEIKKKYDWATKRVDELSGRLDHLYNENNRLKKVEYNFYRIERSIGKEKSIKLLNMKSDWN